jgi:hypothetical protein
MKLNTSTKGKLIPSCSRRWGWAEIHWSNRDNTDWRLDQYTNPVLDEYNLEGLRVGSGLIKTDVEGKKFINTAQSFKDRRGYICSSVTQWIIVEIQPILGIEYVLMDSFPHFEVWGFLQPYNIGNRTDMKKDNGWVSDDIPRAGWFKTEICWFKEVGNGGIPKYIPKMSQRLWNDEKGEPIPGGKIAGWKNIDCVLTSGDSPSLKHHPVRPSYGAGKRFLFKIPVIVKNILTPSDIVKNQENFLKCNPNVTLSDEQKLQMLRFEIGSFLKIWVRNSTFSWDKEAEPADDNTTKTMMQMHKIDCAALHPNNNFLKPVLTPAVQIDRLNDPDSVSEYVNYYYRSGAGLTELSLKQASQNAPTDASSVAITPMSVMEMKIPAHLDDGLDIIPPGEDANSFLKPADKTIPDKFDENPANEQKNRYKCGNEFFRPYSFRNHVWKRNRFTADGKYNDKEYFYVALWPEEFLEKLDSAFVKDPSRATLPEFLGVTLVYIGFLYLLSLAAQKSAKQAKSKGKEKDSGLIKAILEHDDWPLAAAILGCYGFPNPKETSWLDKSEPKTFENMIKEFKKRLEDSTVSAEKMFSTAYKLLQTYFVCTLDANGYKSIANLDQWSKTIDRMKYRTTGYENIKKKTEFGSIKGSLVDNEIEFTGVETTFVKAKAWPLPPPYLSWLVIAAAFKCSTEVKGKVDLSNFGDLEFKLDTTITGELPGVHVLLAPFWTMMAELDTAFTGCKVEKSHKISAKEHWDVKKKYEKEGKDWEFAKVIEQLLDYFGAKLELAVKISVNGKFVFKTDFKKMPDFLKALFAEITPDWGGTIAIEIPLIAKLSVKEWNLGTISCTLLAVSPSAVALFPDGITLQGDMFNGKIVLSDFKWMRWKLNDAFLYDDFTLTSKTELVLGRILESKIHSKAVVPKNLQKSGSKAPFFNVKFLYETENVELVTTAEWKQPEKMDLEIDSLCVLKSLLGINQATLRTETGISKLVKKILKKDIIGTLECNLVADSTQKKVLTGNQKVIFKSPRIIQINVPNASVTLKDTIYIQFKTYNMELLGCPIYCKLYNTTNGKNSGEIRRKDNIKGHFECVQETSDTYSLYIPLYEMGMITGEPVMDAGMKYYKVAFQFSFDFEGNYPLLYEDNIGAAADKNLNANNIKVYLAS